MRTTMATETVAQSPDVTREQIAAMDFEALLTADEIKELASTNQGWEPTGRVALAVLGKSKAELLQPFNDDPEAAADAVIGLRDACADYRERLLIMAEQAGAAQARLEVVMAAVLVRVDNDGGERAQP